MQVDKTKEATVDQRSFRDTLLNKSVDAVIPEVIADSEGKGLGDLYDKAIVGKVHNFSILSSIDRLIKEVWNSKCQLKYIGGFYLLLELDSRVERDEFFGRKEVWQEWFSWAETWSGQSLMVDRIAWLKIYGLPLHIAETKVFDDIAATVGEVVQAAQFPEADVFSYAYVGVLAKGVDRIRGKCKVKWNDESYMVLIEEDTEDWVPDCVFDVLDEEEAVRPSPNDSEVEIAAVVENAVPQKVQESSTMLPVEDNGHQPHPNGVFVNNVVEDRGVKSSKRKGGGYTKKKGTLRRSCSPLDKDRPKKRIREDNDDLFDIDRLIFSNTGHLNVDLCNPRQVDVQEEFMTPDLNTDMEVGKENDEDPSNGVRKEVADTMAFANDLGVVNIERYESAVLKSVNEEGLQGVIQ